MSYNEQNDYDRLKVLILVGVWVFLTVLAFNVGYYLAEKM